MDDNGLKPLEDRVHFGVTVRDGITGVVGVVVARTEYWRRDVMLGIQPPGKEDNTVTDCQWIYEADAEVLSEPSGEHRPIGFHSRRKS